MIGTEVAAVDSNGLTEEGTCIGDDEMVWNVEEEGIGACNWGVGVRDGIGDVETVGE